MPVDDEERQSLVKETSGLNDDNNSVTSSSSDGSYTPRKSKPSSPSCCRKTMQWILFLVLALGLTIGVKFLIGPRLTFIPSFISEHAHNRGSNPTTSTTAGSPSSSNDDDDRDSTPNTSTTAGSPSSSEIDDAFAVDDNDGDDTFNSQFSGTSNLNDNDDNSSSNGDENDDWNGANGDENDDWNGANGDENDDWNGANDDENGIPSSSQNDDDLANDDVSYIDGANDDENDSFNDDMVNVKSHDVDGNDGDDTFNSNDNNGTFNSNDNDDNNSWNGDDGDDDDDYSNNSSGFDDSLTQRKCTTSYRTFHEQSTEDKQLYKLALQKGFGECGGAEHTSAARTAEGFKLYLAEPEETDKGEESIGWMWLKPAKKAVGVRHITLPFQAMDESNNPRRHGGDEFVLTFQGWSESFADSDMVVVKTATVAIDRGDGVYYATLAIPDIPFQKFELNLMLYYSCYQGFFYPGFVPSTSQYFTLESGPYQVEPHLNFQKVLNGPEEKDWQWWTNAGTEERSWKTVPECDNSQLGIDNFTNGIWAEQVTQTNGDDGFPQLTSDAIWQPLCCRTPRNEGAYDHQKLFIGDSTMPHADFNVGNVYDVMNPSHSEWIEYLWHLSRDDHEDRVLVLSVGLDYIKDGYNPKTTVELVTRMLCQLSVLFLGKVLLTDIVPIQQQLYRDVTLTDQNVRTVNAMLHHKVEKAGGRLSDICAYSSIETLYGSIDSNGNQIVNSKENVSHSDSFENLHSKMLTISTKRQEMYADRKVIFADTYKILLPRPETNTAEGEMQRGRADQMQVFDAHVKFVNDLFDMRFEDTEL